MSPLVVVLLAGSFVLVLIAILLGWFYRDLIKESEIGVVLGLFGLIPLLCGLYGLQWFVRKQSIKVYENGFVCKQSGETQTVFWHDIQEFNEAITLYIVQGVPVRKREHSVTASGDQTIVMGQHIRNVAKIGERIRQETFKRKFPDALDRILKGQAIRFGSVVLTKDTLTIEGYEINLGNIRKVQSLDGKIVIKGDSCLESAISTTQKRRMRMSSLRY
jgi:hypothetical protein